MRFHVTDERDWTYEFDAADVEALRAGVRRGWDTWIAGHSADVVGHPAFAFPRRMAEIDAWLEVRMAREGATAEQIASWNANATHERFLARRDLGGSAELSPLRIHVQDHRGVWCTPNDGKPYAPSVARALDIAEAEAIFAKAGRMVTHVRALDGLCDSVGEAVREHLYPKPKLVQ